MPEPGRDVVSFLARIPNGFDEGLRDGLRARGFAVRVRYEGDPASIGRAWTIDARPGDRIADHVWQELDAFRGAGRGTRTVVLAGWATPRSIARRTVGLATTFGARRRTVYWGEPLGAQRGVAKVAQRAFFGGPGLDAVLAIGSHAIASYRAATGGRVPVHVLPYTTDRGLEAEASPAEQPTIGFAGRLVGWKNVGVVIRALSLLPVGQRPAFEIVGSGPLESDLRALAAELDVEVTFVGEVEPDEVASHRTRWWASIQPSREVDGWGLAVAESLNGGTPVIASPRVGAAVDLVRPGRNGVLVGADDVDNPSRGADAIASATSGDLASPGEVRAMASPFLPDRAAAWLGDLLRTDLREERSFIDDGWAAFDFDRR